MPQGFSMGHGANMSAVGMRQDTMGKSESMFNLMFIQFILREICINSNWVVYCLVLGLKKKYSTAK